MLDPIADKLLTSAAFISLVQLDLAPAWMVALIIGREFAITGAAQPRLHQGHHHSGVAARQDQDGVAGDRDPAADSRLGPAAVAGAGSGSVALWVVMVTAVVSAVDYYRRFQLLLNARVTDVNVARERKAG